MYAIRSYYVIIRSVKMSNYYNQESSEVLSNVKSNPNGLADFQVNGNREKFGTNELA